MDRLFNDICVLVTAAFALTFVPGLTVQERSLLSMRDRGTALLVFLVLGLVEEASASHSGWLNERRGSLCGWLGGRPLRRTGRKHVCDLAGGKI